MTVTDVHVPTLTTPAAALAVAFGDASAIAEPGPTEAERVAAELARQPRGLSVEQWQAYLCSFEGTGPMPYRFTAADYATVRARVEAGELTVPERIMRHAPAPVVKRNWWER